jgi:hypothetical protein
MSSFNLLFLSLEPSFDLAISLTRTEPWTVIFLAALFAHRLITGRTQTQ